MTRIAWPQIILLATCVALCSTPILSDVIPRSWDFSIIVAAVDGNGMIKSAEGEIFRLFGIFPTEGFPGYAEKELIGKKLSCNDAGLTGTRVMLMVDDLVRAIDCSASYDSDGPHSPSLQADLIKDGVAIEYCPESRNLYNTCPSAE